MQGSIGRARAELVGRLRERRAEIEAALLTRTYAIADPAETADPEYAQGLRAAVSAALDYGLEGIERGEERAPPIPVLLLAQARLAARNGVPLDTVLRRYFAGYTLLGDFIVQEAGNANLGEIWLKRFLRDQAAMFDAFLAAVTEEHGREGESCPVSREERRAERVRRLLDGELVDASDLEYELEGHHLGLIASGPGAGEAVRDLAGQLDRRLLLTRCDESTIWAWLGGLRPLDAERLQRSISSPWPAEIRLAMGEPGEGIAAWRRTHQQARAVLPVALNGAQPVASYGDFALLTSVLQDDLLATSLRHLFIEPLKRERDGGEVAFETLRAYFAAERNAASAAAVLGISRQAVNGRLRIIEERLGRSVNGSAAELEVALRARELEGRAAHRPSPPGLD